MIRIKKLKTALPGDEAKRLSISYARVSTADQAASGLGLDAQESACRAMAERELYAPVLTQTGQTAWADAGVSASAKVRPMLEMALQECKDQAEAGHDVALIVHSLSRLARSVVELRRIIDQLEDAGITLISCTEKIDTSTAAGRLMITVLGAIYEMERDMVRERTQAALDAKYNQGKVTGPEPYGYMRDAEGNLIIRDDEQLVVASMMELRESGAGDHKIAQHLNRAGIAPRNGLRWHPSTVKKILDRVDTEGGPAARIVGR